MAKKIRIMVTLNEKQYEILKELEELGSTDAEKLRNALVAYWNLRRVMEKGKDVNSLTKT